MNILLVHNFYKNPGGEDTVFYNEKSLLLNKGNRVVTYVRYNKEIDSFNVIQKMLLPFKYFFSLKTYLDVRKIIKENQIDVVHVHNTLTLIGGAVYYASRHSNVPIVQTVHNFRFLCPNGLMCRKGKICEACVSYNLTEALKHKCYHDSFLQTFCIVLSLKLQRFTKLYRYINFICLTNFNRDMLLKLNCVDKNKVYVKPNSINVQNLKINSFETRKNYFCFVGRLDEFKGIRELLKAIKEHSNIELYICGDGPLREWCEEFIENNKLNCKVLGNIAHDRVLKLISYSKGTIIPSIWYEGLPMTIIETFSTGTPVIGRDLGNISSLVADLKIGRLFENNKELVELLEKGFIFDPNYIYDHFLLNYSDDVNYRHLIGIYEDVTKEYK